MRLYPTIATGLTLIQGVLGNGTFGVVGAMAAPDAERAADPMRSKRRDRNSAVPRKSRQSQPSSLRCQLLASGHSHSHLSRPHHGLLVGGTWTVDWHVSVGT